MLRLRPLVVVAALVALPSCMIDLWLGAGGVHTPGDTGETKRVWTAGAAAGVYLDRGASRVRVAASTFADRTYVRTPAVSTVTSTGFLSARADVLLSEPTSEETLHRLTGIASLGTRDDAVDVNGATYPAAGRPFKLFAGYTRTINDREYRNQLFSDSITFSVGPYVSRCALYNDPMVTSAGTGDLFGAGLEFHATVAFSPMTVLGKLGLAVTEAPKSNAPASQTGYTPKGRTCETTRVCTRDVNGNEHCMDSYGCHD